MAWRAAHVAEVKIVPETPLITAADVAPILPGHFVWDAWPLTDPDGRTARIQGREYWMMLSSRAMDDPLKRHDEARIRLIALDGKGWEDCGNLLPEGLTPGPREWAGSAVWEDATGVATLYYTVAGRLGEGFSFEQRMFETRGRFKGGRFAGWTVPTQLFEPDPRWYVDTRTTQGGPGMIKGFRDPAWFRDPADGTAYLTFAGSDANSDDSFNGIAGIARRENARWVQLPPIVSADGLNNELERPHLIARDGRYYLFWSTQRHVFANADGPTGLYGAVADTVLGPYRPLNGSGLVAANPAAEPYQTYSWLVLDTLEVVSFIDFWGLESRDWRDDTAETRAQFAGTPAPRFRIALDGETARLVS